VTTHADPRDPRRSREIEEHGGSPRTLEQRGGPPSQRETIASFGPFRLRTTERVLEKHGRPLKIGSRALDILITLVQHAPEVVSKRDLIRCVWGQLVVHEVSLRVHVTALRKQLDDENSSFSYIINIPGRGYCFAGAVAWTGEATPTRPRTAAPQQLPRAPLLMVGRDDVVRDLAALLSRQRFVSIVGAGGIGKTSVALTLAHRMSPEFSGAVYFFDLAAVEDPRVLPSLLASQLGLVSVSDQSLTLALTFLRDQRVMLVFDSCERIIEHIAAMAENIFREAPQVHILVTSREALRAEGEHVHHLPPLECPPSSVDSLTAAQALDYAAVQLFVKQVANNAHAFELTDADAPIVAEICRRLDGIALALELAASRVAAHGVQGTASLLDKQFRLLWRGRRTALPRHQTLSATLDWSYNLLSQTEQLILRRLAVFVGGFSLEAALEVAAEGLDPAQLSETIATLVDKSLLTSDGTAVMRYRLLDTTRSYAWQKLAEAAEDRKILRLHCQYLVRALEQFGSTIWALPSPESMHFFGLNLGNLRAALEWSFSQRDTQLGAKLVGVSACLFLQAGILHECVAWTERAIESLGTLGAGTPLELELLVCFASSLMITKGNIPAAHIALTRALDITEKLKAAAPMQLCLLQALYKWQIRSGDFHGLRELTSRIATVAKQISDPLADAIAHGTYAVTCYFTGDNHEVLEHARIALVHPDTHLSKLNLTSFGQLHGIRSILARNLWALGYPEQAMATAEEAVQEADDLNHPHPLCYVLMSCVMVPLETGDWQRAEEWIQRVSVIATKHHLASYSRACVGWQGRLAVSRGDLSRGIALLRTSMAALHEDGYELYRPQLAVALAEGLAKCGQRELAYSTICDELCWAETRGRTLHFINLLRAKGEILMSLSHRNATEAEKCLQESLRLAQQRGLLALELRVAICLARLRADRGGRREALELLEPVLGRFSEGFRTRDLVVATTLLQQLRS